MPAAYRRRMATEERVVVIGARVSGLTTAFVLAETGLAGRAVSRGGRLRAAQKLG